MLGHDPPSAHPLSTIAVNVIVSAFKAAFAVGSNVILNVRRQLT